MDTAEVIEGMLRENTGASCLDSGSAYGRNWEKNRKRDFEEEPEVLLEVDGDYILSTISTYHFLVKYLEYSQRMNNLFETFIEDREDDGWLTLMEEFVDFIGGKGLYGDSDPVMVNTYNYESSLDQTLQYIYFEHMGESYVFLQVHGGCDVRGGYTKPVVFRIGEHEESEGFLCESGGIYCSSCQAGWDLHGNANSSGIPNLDDCTVYDVERDRDKEIPEEDVIRVEDDIIHCPSCGKGVLGVSLY